MPILLALLFSLFRGERPRSGTVDQIPFNSILERVVRCWHSYAYSSLFSSLFFRLPPNKFLQIPPDLSPVSIRLALLFLLSSHRWELAIVWIELDGASA